MLASLICLELFLLVPFLGSVVGISYLALRGCCLITNSVCGNAGERRGLCLAGEDLAQGMLVTMSFGVGGVTSHCCSHCCSPTA